eukprot:COSAG05_NODE_11137_length_529_cov_0.620930_2_plen_76_part_00
MAQQVARELRSKQKKQKKQTQQQKKKKKKQKKQRQRQRRTSPRDMHSDDSQTRVSSLSQPSPLQLLPQTLKGNHF